MLGLIPILLRILFMGSGEVLRACVKGLLCHHPMAPCIPGVQPLLNHTSDLLVCGDVKGSLQHHCLKDN